MFKNGFILEACHICTGSWINSLQGNVNNSKLICCTALLWLYSVFRYATILAFDVKVEREAQEMADGLDVKIFTADIIYHLFDKFMAYREKLKKRKQEEFKVWMGIRMFVNNIAIQRTPQMASEKEAISSPLMLL